MDKGRAELGKENGKKQRQHKMFVDETVFYIKTSPCIKNTRAINGLVELLDHRISARLGIGKALCSHITVADGIQLTLSLLVVVEMLFQTSMGQKIVKYDMGK